MPRIEDRFKKQFAFEDKYAGGAYGSTGPSGTGGFAEYEAFQAGDKPAWEIKSPAAHRAALEHFNAGGANPMVEKRRAELTNAAAQRANNPSIPIPGTPLLQSPNQWIASRAGTGQPHQPNPEAVARQKEREQRAQGMLQQRIAARNAPQRGQPQAIPLSDGSTIINGQVIPPLSYYKEKAAGNRLTQQNERVNRARAGALGQQGHQLPDDADFTLPPDQFADIYSPDPKAQAEAQKQQQAQQEADTDRNTAMAHFEAARGRISPQAQQQIQQAIEQGVPSKEIQGLIERYTPEKKEPKPRKEPSVSDLDRLVPYVGEKYEDGGEVPEEPGKRRERFTEARKLYDEMFPEEQESEEAVANLAPLKPPAQEVGAPNVSGYHHPLSDARPGNDPQIESVAQQVLADPAFANATDEEIAEEVKRRLGSAG